MRERTGQFLKFACYALAALLIYQLVQTALRVNPLRRVVIPALPTLASDTNAPVVGAPVSGPASGSTSSAGTNSPAKKTAKEAGTNLAASVAGKSGSSNSAGPLTPAHSPSEGEKEKEKPAALAGAASVPTNSPTPEIQPKVEVAGTNSISIVLSTNTTNASSLALATNLPPAMVAAGTNTSLVMAAAGTNVTGTNAPAKPKGTNSSSAKAAMAGMNMSPSMMRGNGSGGGKSDLPPEIKARVDRIYESELFGQVMRPQPMALQGIAGNSAFLRSPSGQTGLVKEGDTLGEIKLLRIGVNRVLVEQDGQKSELMIFNGYGGESLMPKDKETSK